MVDVFVSVGSNVEREKNIVRAVNRMREEFNDLETSSVYESEAVGFDGAPFLNLVVRFSTETSIGEVIACLKSIESESGRDRTAPRFSDRTLDLDLLLYGDETIHTEELDVPRAEITTQAFILGPMTELAADRLHPEHQLTFRELWARFDQSLQRILPFKVDGLC